MGRAFLKLHLALLLAGFTGIFGRLISLNEGLLSWYRLLIAAVIMLLLFSIKHKRTGLKIKDKKRIALSGIILACHWLFFYGSIKYANVSVGVVCFALTSFFNALLEPLLVKGKKLNLRELLLSSITLMGVAFIFGLDAHYRTGVILGVISAVFSASFSIYNEGISRTYQSDAILLYQMLGGLSGLTVILPFFLAISPPAIFLPSLTDLGYLILLSGICTVCMYYLITSVFRKLSSFTVSLSFNLEPVYSIILAMVIFHENKELGINFYIGLLLVVMSLCLQMRRIWRIAKKKRLSIQPADIIANLPPVK